MVEVGLERYSRQFQIKDTLAKTELKILWSKLNLRYSNQSWVENNIIEDELKSLDARLKII